MHVDLPLFTDPNIQLILIVDNENHARGGFLGGNSPARFIKRQAGLSSSATGTSRELRYLHHDGHHHLLLYDGVMIGPACGLASCCS